MRLGARFRGLRTRAATRAAERCARHAANVLSGSDLLVLRAAIEALGTLQVATDLTVLAPLLNHPSRDIRTTTADALRDLCNSQAIAPLRVRYSEETVAQVQLAISQAPAAFERSAVFGSVSSARGRPAKLAGC
jgi:HEAT repeat protein